MAPAVTKGMPAFWKTGPAASAESRVGVAEASQDLVLLDELLRGLRSDVHLVLAVVDDEVDRLAEDTAVGVYLFLVLFRVEPPSHATAVPESLAPATAGAYWQQASRNFSAQFAVLVVAELSWARTSDQLCSVGTPYTTGEYTRTKS